MKNPRTRMKTKTKKRKAKGRLLSHQAPSLLRRPGSQSWSLSTSFVWPPEAISNLSPQTSRSNPPARGGWPRDGQRRPGDAAACKILRYGFAHAVLIAACGFRILQTLSSVADSHRLSETNHDVSNSKRDHLGSQSSGFNSPHHQSAWIGTAIISRARLLMRGMHYERNALSCKPCVWASGFPGSLGFSRRPPHKPSRC